MSTLKISARNAGQVELEKYCPRCCWYLLRLKKMPFQIGMPGIMFYMERAEKEFILSFLKKFDAVPKYFGPFADCIEPVEFPFSMCEHHEETGVDVSARVDMMLRKKDGKICLLDLKTAKPDGGGKVFRPQYEIQVIGYSWVAEAAGIGDVGTAGLLYGDIQLDEFLKDPLKFKTDAGINVPFRFHAHEVELDYSRLTRCLKEMNKLWQDARPPKGADDCKDCQLLTRLIDFETSIRASDQRLFVTAPEYRAYLHTQDYYRKLTRSFSSAEALLNDEEWEWDKDGGMWMNWDFS
jgi:hypothetical protein